MLSEFASTTAAISLSLIMPHNPSVQSMMMSPLLT